MQIGKAVVAIVALLLFSELASAKLADHLAVGRPKNENLGTWAVGDGAQVVSQILCVSSANYDNNYTPPPPVLVPPATKLSYRFKVTDLATPVGYYLYLNGDESQTGNGRIKVDFRHRDIMIASPSWQTLSDDVYDTHVHVGGFKQCRDGDNTEVEMTLTVTELQKAKGGSYSGSFQIGAIGGSSTTATDTANFNVLITVATNVRVSGLQNINFGSWGGGDVSAIETFCVYSSNAAASYSITLNSPNQDGGGNFFLANSSATPTVPYKLEFKDNLTAGGGTVVTTSALSGNGNNSAPDCAMVDNTKITVTVLAIDLNAAPVDDYSDTITLFVVPI